MGEGLVGHRRLRLVDVTLQARFVIDDGDVLESITAQPMSVSAKEWPNVLSLFAAAVEQLTAQVEGPLASLNGKAPQEAAARQT
jgi:hypothetical protein